MNTAEAIEMFAKRPDLEYMIAAAEDLISRVKGAQLEMLTDLLPVLRAALERRNQEP
jgi:hypothetical protein